MRPGVYLRVSSQDQVEGFSLDSQERLAREYCAAQGWPEPQFFTDAGISAYTDEIAHRPAFVAALDAAAAGQITHLVTIDLDRFARSTIVALTAVRQLERAGVPLISLNQAYDHTTPDGRLLFTVSAAFAQLTSEQISRKTKAGLAQKRHAGLHVGGVPFGARRVDGRLQLDPDRAPALARLLELAATMSSVQVAATLTAEGVPLPKRGAKRDYWHYGSVESIVQRGAWLLSQPEPWPTRWRAARYRHPLVPVRRTVQRRMLSGLMVCPCGGHVTVGRPHRDGVRSFLRCRNFQDRPRGSGCPYRRHTLDYYEPLVLAWVAGLHLVLDTVVTSGDGAAERAALAEQRRLLWKGFEHGGLTEAEYDARVAVLAEREAHLPPAGERKLAVTPDLLDAQAAFSELSPADQNVLLRSWLQAVVVVGDKATPVPRPLFAQLLAACREK